MDITNEEQLVSFKFATRDELLDRVRAFYSKRGYALSILRSTAEKCMVLRCDRGGHYRNTHNISEDQRKKFTGSHLVNCPFQLYGKKHKEGTWTIEIRNNNHNHDPSNDISGHSLFCRVTSDDLKEIERMTNCGVQPRQILSSLRQQNPNTRVVSRTIYNATQKIRKDNLEGRSVIQALFEELGRGGFKFNILQDEVGHITHFFFADPRSIMLTKSFQNVFVMDCTYKTNKYQMPLLNIIGITSFYSSFFSAFVFLKNECTEDYIWALQMFKETLENDNQPLVIITDRQLALMKAIRVVFPSATNLLCVWHINKNMLTKCKKVFETKEDCDKCMSDWEKIVYSSTKDEYNDSLCEFESTYKEKNDVIAYIKETWLPLKEKFVSAWTEKHLHLGNRASSRVEGAHAKLKKYLQVSTGDLQIIKNRICLVIENEFNEITVQLAKEKIQVPHACSIPFFRNLLRRISLFALRKLYEQYEMARKGTMNSVCTGEFMAMMGMPCAHKMEHWKTGSLSLDQIHPQWRIDTRELNDLDCNLSDGRHSRFKNSLDNLYLEYLNWPLDKKKLVEEKIQEIINKPDVSFEPTIPSHENRSQVAKKRKAKCSTRRDPSQFEIVKARWESNAASSSNASTQPKQMHQATDISVLKFEVPAEISDDGVFD